MLKVSNQELLALMKDKKVVSMLEQDKQEDKKEELFRKQMIVTLQGIVKSLDKESTHSETDLTPLVMAVKEVAKAQMDLCKMMTPKEHTPCKWVFTVKRDSYGNIKEIEADEQCNG